MVQNRRNKRLKYTNTSLYSHPKQQLNIGTMLRQCSYVVGMLNVGYECCNNIEPILSSNWNIDSMLCEHYIVLCEILNVVCTLCQCCNLTYLNG